MHMYMMCDITKMQDCLFLADDGGGVFRCARQMPARQLCSAMKTCYMYKIKLNLTFIVAPLKKHVWTQNTLFKWTTDFTGTVIFN
jgi:hypothetical protein